MPIEVQIEKTHGKNLPPAETQRAVPRLRDRADRRARSEQFKRLGVLGDWDHPYTTMAYKNEADEIRTLGKLLEKGYLYRGLKPVNWCFDCGSALAEAEVEYEDRSRPRDRRRLPARRRAERAKLARGVRPGERARRPGLRGDLDDDAVDDPGQPGAERPSRDRRTRSCDTPRGHLVARRGSRRGVPRALQARGHDRRDARRARRSSTIAFRHPFYDRASPVYLGEYVTLEQGTGIVHSVARVRRRGLPCRAAATA